MTVAKYLQLEQVPLRCTSRVYSGAPPDPHALLPPFRRLELRAASFVFGTLGNVPSFVKAKHLRLEQVSLSCTCVYAPPLPRSWPSPADLFFFSEKPPIFWSQYRVLRLLTPLLHRSRPCPATLPLLLRKPPTSRDPERTSWSWRVPKRWIVSPSRTCR